MGLASAWERLSSAGLGSACHRTAPCQHAAAVWSLWMEVLPLHGMSLGPQTQCAPMHDQGTVLLGTSVRCHRRSGAHGPLPSSAVTSHSTPPHPCPMPTWHANPLQGNFLPKWPNLQLSSDIFPPPPKAGTALLGDYFINIKSKVPSAPSI